MTRFSARHRLAVVAAAGLLATVQPAAAQTPSFPSRSDSVDGGQIASYVAEASQRFGIPDAWIRAVMRVESAGEVGITSSAGAMGLMQVMPQTYATLRARLGLGANAYDPHDNIMAGSAFLREMHDRYGDAGFLAAYNAGPGRYEEYRAGGRPLPSETILYMARLGPMLGVSVEPMQLADVPTVVVKPEEAPIFVSLAGRQSASGSRQNSRPNVQLAMVDSPTSEQANGLFTAHPPAVDNHVAPNPTVRSPATSPQDEHNGTPASVLQGGQSDGIFVLRGPVHISP